MGIAGLVLAAAAVLQAGQAPARDPQPLPEPLVDPVRVEIRITTRSTAVNVDFSEACTAAGLRSFTGPADASVFADCRFSGFGSVSLGVESVAVFRAVLLAADAQPSTSLTFRSLSRLVPVAYVVANVNDESRPVEVARGTFVDRAEVPLSRSLLRSNGPLPVPAPRDRLVLAHYYPWWDRASWGDTRLLDTPRQLYSTDDPADVARVLRDMRATGIDVAVVSWQGSESRDGFYARGLRRALDAAQQAGIRVSVMLETAAANRVREGEPPDVDVLAGWMTELLDGYANHPAFLTVDGRPVLFAYIWDFAGEDVWRTVLGRVHASGRRPMVMADTTASAPLALADGLFTYSGTLFEKPPVRAVKRSVAAGRTWHLLGSEFGGRRIAAASVIPGYDETRLGRDTRRAVDREGGEFYDRQWQAALASNPDWVVITSWNEWAENTHIEAGQRFGETYIWRTRFWSAAFKHAPR